MSGEEATSPEASEAAPPAPLVSVSDLHVDFHARDGIVNAVSGVSFDVGRGEIVAIVGESGSGKSATALSLLGLTREAGASLSGGVWFAGKGGAGSENASGLRRAVGVVGAQGAAGAGDAARSGGAARVGGAVDMLTASPKQLRALRGDAVSIVFQDPLSSLNPVMRIGAQIAEQVRAHRDVSKAEAFDVASRSLERAGLRDGEREGRGGSRRRGQEASRYSTAYPHELSGGQRQRAMIAMAISCDPLLLVADEPTTALDVTTQSEILRELSRLRSESGLSVVLVTHDLAVVSGIADRVLVMSSGRIVEEGKTEEIFERPQSEAARLLLASISKLYSRGAASGPADRSANEGASVGADGERSDGGRGRVHVGNGVSGDVANGVSGEGPNGVSGDVANGVSGEGPNGVSGDVANGVSGEGPNGVSGEAPLLELSDLSVSYPARHRGRAVSALRKVSVTVEKGETLGIVGESGSGKSTLLRCASRLLSVESGTIRFRGVDVTDASRRALRPLRSGVQMVFQDPDASLNPKHTVSKILRTPLRLRGVERSQVDSEVISLLGEVGLAAEHANRFPHELSGGQRQRVGIARALAMDPDLLLLDEPVSSLDVSVRAQIVELLDGLRRRRGLSCVFVAHDIALVASVSDRIAVMHEGKIVECGLAEDVYKRPSHEYTRSLLAAAPAPDPVTARG